MIVYSLLLVIVMIFKPSGLFGRYDFSLCNVLGSLGAKIRSLGKKNKPPKDSDSSESDDPFDTADSGDFTDSQDSGITAGQMEQVSVDYEKEEMEGGEQV